MLSDVTVTCAEGDAGQTRTVAGYTGALTCPVVARVCYDGPTAAPTAAPTKVPTAAPSKAPTRAPTAHPSPAPSFAPSKRPTAPPVADPTIALLRKKALFRMGLEKPAQNWFMILY